MTILAQQKRCGEEERACEDKAAAEAGEKKRHGGMCWVELAMVVGLETMY
jgi:hypothetical protein|tara:strand:+ start:6047 stop:6196 length:150 start_codon:yes stop_codon:yes gene_type:complete